jgi:hypothetical protein
VDTNELLRIIGAQQVEIYTLKARLHWLEQIEAAKAVPTAVK